MTDTKKQRRVGRPTGGGGQAKVPSTEELTRVEKCLSGTRTELRDRAMLYLQYATGMRAGELASLDIGDVLHRGTIAREFRLGTEDTVRKEAFPISPRRMSNAGGSSTRRKLLP